VPNVRGLDRYSAAELDVILAECSALADPQQRLEACATALTARLVADGYVNSRAYVDRGRPNSLFVVEGVLAEVRVNGEDRRAVRQARRLLAPLQGQVLHLPSLERRLQWLRRQRGVASVRGNLSRLGSDPANAAFNVTVVGETPPWRGEFSLRNDGSNDSGQARLVGNLFKPDLVLPDDNLLLYGESSFGDNAEFGSVISSISYALPLAQNLSLTGAFGYSRRNLIDLPPPADLLAVRQYQFLGQLEWVFRESASQRWSVFAGLSHNRSTTFLDGRRFDTDFVPESAVEPRSGYLQVGVNGGGAGTNLAWNGSAYFLQGIAGFTPGRQRRELAVVDIEPGEARALGGYLSASWAFAPRWQLNARTAGQISLNPLTSPMRFTLGSDTGLRGLPGQLISGDDGWLGSGELVWTFWNDQRNALQLVPFIGVGWVRTEFPDLSFSDTIGAGGMFVRWLGGRNWEVDLGWVGQFSDDDNLGGWKDWLLDDGLYAKLSFRF
jgi:hemolysin activation/secretion protein